MSVTFSIAGANEPTCNFSNTNAVNVCRLVGLPIETADGLTGVLGGDELSALRQRIVRAINSPRMRACLISDTREHRAPGGGRIIECGVDDDSTVYRLHALLGVVVVAHELGKDLVWG